MASKHCSFVALKTGLQHLHTTHLHQWLANGLPGWVAAFAEPWESLEDALTPTTNPAPHYKVLLSRNWSPPCHTAQIQVSHAFAFVPPSPLFASQAFRIGDHRSRIYCSFLEPFDGGLIFVIIWLFHWMITTMLIGLLIGASGAGNLSISSLDGDDHGNNNGDWLVVFDFVILWLLRHICLNSHKIYWHEMMMIIIGWSWQ